MTSTFRIRIEVSTHLIWERDQGELLKIPMPIMPCRNAVMVSPKCAIFGLGAKTYGQHKLLDFSSRVDFAVLIKKALRNQRLGIRSTRMPKL